MFSTALPSEARGLSLMLKKAGTTNGKGIFVSKTVNVAIPILLSFYLVGCASIPRSIYHKGRTATHVVGRELRDNDKEKWDVSVGRITMSTPLFRPVKEAKTGEKGPLDFGAKKSIPELYTALQKSGLDISNVQARVREFQLAAALQGTLSTTESTQESALAASLAGSLGLDGKASGGIDPTIKDVTALQQLLESILSSAEISTAISAAAEGKGSISNTSKTTTVDAPPEVPTDLPDLATLPDGIAAKMVGLLERSEVERVVPQADLANLAGSLAVHMANMEQYYFPGSWVGDLKSISADWAAYQVNFNVSAEPGWYTHLNQYDGVVEATFSLLNKEGEAPLEGSVKVLSVVPFEEAQAISEIDAALDSMSTAVSLSAAFQAIGIKGAYKDLRQLTTRLDGLRTTNTMNVSYPRENTVAIRMRPPAVPNRNGRDLQPRSRVFTATMLVRQDKDAKIAAGNGSTNAAAEKAGWVGVFSGAPKYVKNEAEAWEDISTHSTSNDRNNGSAVKEVPASAICAIELDTYWEPTLMVGNWQEFPWRNGTRYSKPYLKKRLRSHLCHCDGRTLSLNVCQYHRIDAVVPPARVATGDARKKGFKIESAEGVFWRVGSMAKAAILVRTTAPLSDDIKFLVAGHQVVTDEFNGQEAIIEVDLSGTDIDETKPFSVVLLVLGGEKSTVGQMVTLVPQERKKSTADVKSSNIKIDVKSPAVSAEKIPLNVQTLELLKILLGEEFRLLTGQVVQRN